jgi:hypothetical protein
LEYFTPLGFILSDFLGIIGVFRDLFWWIFPKSPGSLLEDVSTELMLGYVSLDLMLR